MSHSFDVDQILRQAQPITKQTAHEVQSFGHLISEVIRTNELQVWFVAEHVVDVPVVKVDPKGNVDI